MIIAGRFFRFGERYHFWNLAEKDLSRVKIYSSNNAWLLKSRVVVLVLASCVYKKRVSSCRPPVESKPINFHQQSGVEFSFIFIPNVHVLCTIILGVYIYYICVCIRYYFSQARGRPRPKNIGPTKMSVRCPHI